MRTIVAAVLASSLALASGEGRSAEAAIHDATYGFSITAPSFPKEDNTGLTVTPITFTGPVRDGKAPTCNVQIQNMDVTLSAFRSQSLGQFKAVGLTLESEGKRKVSGKDALYFVSSGHDIKVLSLAVQHGPSIYLVTCLAAANQFEKYEKAFQAAMDSFSVD
jgi:hypothetical protein